MIQQTIYISEELTQKMEAYFCEIEQSPWVIYSDKIKKDHRLIGYFQTEEEQISCIQAIREDFELPKETLLKKLKDQDWKESYKKHFKAWSQSNLHWVPNWEKDSYPLPEGHKMLLIDPGMAFGTGNHPTTRLCVQTILEAAEEWKNDLNNKTMIDAGCGSGILALSAALLGFKKLEAFDNDPDAIRISEENANFNHLSGAIQFRTKSLDCLWELEKVDLLIANIQSNVLIAFSKEILNSLKSSSILCLSGILASEKEKVLAHYRAELIKRNLSHKTIVREMEEWVSITFKN
jgi:ribosomal protein L11 methyltransferase